MNPREKVLTIITGAAQELNETLEEQIQLDLGEEAPLYGRQGCLDSLDLVSLILMVEEKVQDEFDTNISLTDDRAVSRFKSPFRSVGTFTDYTTGLLAA